ncbi:MAG: hypothetical protein KF788_15315 [Piscinibacter sp.]|nr:hypothetical protein [Piscinibacter sp.]
MFRSIVRIVVGASAAAFLAVLTACAGLPSSSLPLAQDSHDFIGGQD